MSKISSFYIIKPEILDKANEVEQEILNNWFSIIKNKIIKLLEKDVFKIYDGEDQDFLKLQGIYFKNKLVKIGILKWKTLDDFVKLTWYFSAPNLCKKWTIRNTFWKNSIYINNSKYFLNWIHRPVDIDEFKKVISYILLKINL